jgi:hypothetical protein
VKLSARFALFHCGRCKKDYANPLGHMCTVRMDRTTPVGKTRVAPKVSVSASCSDCGKPKGNPLTHVCVTGSDFKRRKAAAARAAKAARPKHLYQACHDEDCERIPCEAFREGRAEGYQNGHADGSAAGFDAGFAAGAASVSTTSGG